MLREDPDADTVSALRDLATLEVFAGSASADHLSAEALDLGQALGVDDATLAGLFISRGLCHAFAGRNPQAAAYFREAARLATQAGDSMLLGRALLNLADEVTATDPAAGAQAARDATACLRRVGARQELSVAATNLGQALLMTGDWATADAELSQAIDADGLADVELLACSRAWLAALRGDTSAAQATLAGLGDLRASEDPQDKVYIAIVEAFAAADRSPAAALSRARDVLGHAGTLGISCEQLRWAWPLAARAALDLNDFAAARELIALLDSYRPGQLAPMLRAERDLARSRLAALDGDPAVAGAAFAAAIAGLRQHSTPYHLGHGLLDHAAWLAAHGDTSAAADAVSKADDIAARLGCQPLRERAARLADRPDDVASRWPVTQSAGTPA